MISRKAWMINHSGFFLFKLPALSFIKESQNFLAIACGWCKFNNQKKNSIFHLHKKIGGHNGH